MLPFGSRVAADTRVYEEGDYFLSRSYVDGYANEVASRGTARHREISAVDSDEEDDDYEDVPIESSEGDPTDGVDDTSQPAISQCVKNWKAAAADEKKRSWAIFDETGVYASACRHGLILWVADMVRSGEL